MAALTAASTHSAAKKLPTITVQCGSLLRLRFARAEFVGAFCLSVAYALPISDRLGSSLEIRSQKTEEGRYELLCMFTAGARLPGVQEQ